MPAARSRSIRLLPDGTPLHNRLLAALPRTDYDRIAAPRPNDHRDHRRYPAGAPRADQGRLLPEWRCLLRHQRNAERRARGSGHRGARRHAGDRRLLRRSGRNRSHIPAGGRMARCRRWPPRGSSRRPRAPDHFAMSSVVYAQANLLQIMQCTACNALHNVTQRCCRWLLQTHDRVDDDTFSLKQEFLAVMLGVHRPTVTVVLRALQREGLITSRYGRIQILKRKRLEAASCECYGVIRAHFARLGL